MKIAYIDKHTAKINKDDQKKAMMDEALYYLNKASIAKFERNKLKVREKIMKQISQ